MVQIVAKLGGGVSVIDGSKDTVITTIPASSPPLLDHQALLNPKKEILKEVITPWRKTGRCFHNRIS
ncbi:MAG TPA: hypothetical protein VEH06_03550 [Candidatus Bathyarchaeia archaeon]|nr:hypothetical protein [Candidatus Bathyarchaeia archaeon]